MDLDGPERRRVEPGHIAEQPDEIGVDERPVEHEPKVSAGARLDPGAGAELDSGARHLERGRQPAAEPAAGQLGVGRVDRAGGGLDVDHHPVPAASANRPWIVP